ncbi:hypothetical protein CEXT_315171 [Caerostris extrusa]|uniref:Uncharacterized protein n=1 Tax=Caerostris extrusa TaxID=172846 RepID=A0AAV4MA87_CAEEX|nr:hypothetical protein CEXT_315171 [Caerostris extrusa]
MKSRSETFHSSPLFYFGCFYRQVSSLLGDDIPALHKLSHLLAIHHTGMTSRHAAKALHRSAAEISGEKLELFSCTRVNNVKQKNK